MKHWLLMGCLALVGCSAAQKKDEPAPRAGKDVEAAEGVKAALAAWPACAPGAEVGKLAVRATVCTRMFCKDACCNQCGWSATFEGLNATPVEVDAARVKQVLKLGESSLDCEVRAWASALEGVSLSLGEPACVVR